MKKFLLSGLIGLAVIGLTLAAAACGPAYVGVYATAPPPPIRYEAFGPVPGPGFVWVNGNWGWRGNQYAWNAGRWERPPAGRRAWVAGRWENHGGRYRYHEGRWR